LFAFATVFVALDGTRIQETLSAIEVMSAVAATLGNVGPGFGMVGPMGSYLVFTDASKLVMVGLMWVGRLEVLPVLVLFTRTYWQG
jgi:trk system potassium uptake protein TrkH